MSEDPLSVTEVVQWASKANVDAVQAQDQGLPFTKAALFNSTTEYQLIDAETDDDTVPWGDRPTQREANSQGQSAD